MKINSIKPTVGYLNSSTKERTTSRQGEYAKERVNLKQNNYEQINTTIESNSDGRVSFKGAPFLHTAATKVMENPIVAEALFAILITCGLRPFTIMATARTDEEKGKCTYQAVKSVSTGVVGLAMSALVATPLSKLIKKAKDGGALEIPESLKQSSQKAVKEGVDALIKYSDDLARTTGVEETLKGQIADLTKGGKLNLGIFKNMGKGAEKAFGETLSKRAPDVYEKFAKGAQAQKVLNNYSGTAKNVLDKLFQPAFLPIRAAITIALVPVILKALGIKKGGKKPQEAKAQEQTTNTNQAEQKQTVQYDSLKMNMFQGNSDKALFGNFAEVAKYENK